MSMTRGYVVGLMIGHLQQAGMVMTPEAELADVLIINTCSFIDMAKKESIASVHEAVDGREGSKKRARQFAKNRCAIGQSQKLDLEDDSGVLAALRFVAGASATIGRQMLPPLAIESKASLDSIQTVGRSSDALFCACRNSLPCNRAA